MYHVGYRSYFHDDVLSGELQLSQYTWCQIKNKQTCFYNQEQQPQSQSFHEA